MVGFCRFLRAQEGGAYETALEELRAGEKRSHWMWFIFPQVAGLGRSEAARFYALADATEASAYWRHQVLGPRLADCTDAMLTWSGKRRADAILGPLDTVKFRSSMTLFEAAEPETSRFGKALDVFFDGARDEATLERL